MIVLDPKTTFFSSDHHFWHKNVIQYDNRPFCCVHNMNAHLIAQINQTVGQNGTFIAVGDWSFGSRSKREEITKKIVCKNKYLVLGNHDATAKSMKIAGFDEVFHELEVEIDYKKVYISHIPNKQKAPLYDWHIHGHVHTAWVLKENMINVGVCCWDYKPQLFRTLVEQAAFRQKNLKNPGHLDDLRDEDHLRDDIKRKSEEV